MLALSLVHPLDSYSVPLFRGWHGLWEEDLLQTGWIPLEDGT